MTGLLHANVLLLLVVLGGGLWLWVDSLHARELAIRVSRAACKSRGLQLLDDTVALAGMALRRDPTGRPRLRRVYEFEFSPDGTTRRSGSVVVIGRYVVSLHLPEAEV